jgi:hypothetical protein
MNLFLMKLYFVLLVKSHLQSYPCPLQINSSKEIVHKEADKQSWFTGRQSIASCSNRKQKVNGQQKISKEKLVSKQDFSSIGSGITFLSFAMFSTNHKL